MLLNKGLKDALDQHIVKKILPRYVKVAKSDLPPNFQIAKSIVADFDRNLNSSQLWEMHEGLMKKFYETKELIDKGKLNIKDLENPRFSLLNLKIKIAEEVLKECQLCERLCGVDRSGGEAGECKARDCKISSEFIHMGEEPFISPSHTIFFMGCNFHCEYCQNWLISQWFDSGIPTNPQMLAHCIESGKRSGCRNVNFVGGEPTPHLLCILESLNLCDASQAVVWNSNFYMSEKAMQLLDGIVDVYLTDFKYGNDRCAEQLSKVKNYFSVVSRNHLLAAGQAEMVVRHLLLPDHVECCTIPILDWLAEKLRDRSIVNVMGQYTPEFRACDRIDINRKVTDDELKTSINYAKRLKLNCVGLE
jgi:putative pyruvate formate lyase activating enzyme